MAKSNKKIAKITKNADSVTFAEAPFYTLANIRKLALALIVKSSKDPKKVAAIAETLEVLKEFLDVRAKHAAEQRAVDVAAAEKALETKARVAAEHELSEATQQLDNSVAAVKRWTKVREALGAVPQITKA